VSIDKFGPYMYALTFVNYIMIALKRDSLLKGQPVKRMQYLVCRNIC